MRAELSNCLWIPSALFTKKMQEELTFKIYSVTGEYQQTVLAYIKHGGTVGVPRDYGLKSISIPYDNMTSPGHRVKFRKLIKLWDNQKPVVQQMLDAATTMHDFKMKAATGKGKTIMALSFITQRQKTALVIVDQDNLKEQWVKSCKNPDLLGMEDSEVGIVQRDVCDYKGKKIVIAMMQSLLARDYPEDFYSYFGTIVFDEAHTAGAPTFSQALMMFEAECRIGISATINRKDSLDDIITANLGEVEVVLEDEHELSSVYIINYGGVLSWAANNSKLAGRYINDIAANGERNLVIANAAKWLYDSGREVLLISDRVTQLKALEHLCIALGIPADKIGMYAKQTIVLRYIKDPTPPHRPQYWEKGTEYTPVRLSFEQKTLPRKQADANFEACSVLLTTYGIMAKGVDLPRLSAGIDCTPRADATQVHGRVLREQEGKKKPIWVTIADSESFRSLHQLSGRIRSYVSDNSEVYAWDYHKGRKLLDTRVLQRWIKNRVKELKSCRIETTLAGSSMLVTRPMQTDNEALLGSHIEPTSPSPKEPR